MGPVILLFNTNVVNSIETIQFGKNSIASSGYAFVQTTNTINMPHSEIEHPSEELKWTGTESSHGPQRKSFRIVKVVKIVVEKINETVAHNQVTYAGFNYFLA